MPRTQEGPRARGPSCVQDRCIITPAGRCNFTPALTGFVGQEVLYWNDGTQSDAYIGDSSNLTSRFRFTGTAKISPHVTAGFTYEWAGVTNSTGGGNQLNGGDDLGASGAGTGGVGCGTTAIGSSTVGCLTTRDATVWMRHSQLGMVKIGQGSTANDNLVLIDLGMMGVAGSPDIANHAGGYILRSNTGLLSSNGVAVGAIWTGAIRGHEAFDNNRRNHVLYETPSIAGFTVQGAVAEDNYWDVALRYAGEFSGIRIAGGIGYQEDTKLNSAVQTFSSVGALCTSNCDVKSTEVKGSLSLMHVPSGLFVTGSAGNRELEGTSGGTPATAYAGPDLRYWHLAGGVSQNFFGIGKTVLFGEYGEHKGGLAQTSFLGASTGTVQCANATGCDSTVNNWGVGLVQYVDAAALELFATYKVFSLETNSFAAANGSLNSGRDGVSDIQLFMVGTKINF